MRVRTGHARWAAGLALALVLTATAPGAAQADEVGPPLVEVSPAGEWVDSWWVDVTLAVDHDEPLAGYAVTADQEPTTDPGTEVNQVDPLWNPWLSEGENWLHVRAVLADGTVSPVTHTRVGLDTAAPWIEEIRSPTHPWGEVSTSPDLTLEWDVPEDASGVVGYDVRLTEDGAPPADDSDPATGTAVTEPGVDLTVPGDGEWFAHVRALDAAGHWGPFASYVVVLDEVVPAAPTVSGSHVDGVATSQRQVTMTFAEHDGDHVAGWSAVVDQVPGTLPDPAAAQPEAQISTHLAPGTWWLHVVGVEASGRAGDPTHVQLVIRDDPFVLDVPQGKQVWAATTVTGVCAAAGGDLAVVAADGTTTRVGPLVPDATGGTCRADWDPAASGPEGRLWPDGAASLVVVAADGTELSERVPVVVAVGSANVDRLRADYAAGVLAADDLATELLRSAVDPGSVDPAYADDAEARMPSVADLAVALTARDELSDELAELLTPVAEPEEPGDAARRIEPDGAACGPVIWFLELSFDCIAFSEAAVVHWQYDDLGGVDGDELPVEAQTALDGLTSARGVYAGAGFAVPDGPVHAYLTPLTPHGSGLSLPGIDRLIGPDVPPSIIMSSYEVLHYLPYHEYFHQVEYEYMPFTRIANPVNNPYWWLEGSAEWGAHLVQTQTPEVDPVQEYASRLGEFLERSRDSYDAGSVVSGGGPEYGSFVLAEFLEEQYGGADAVRRTWEHIGSWPFGTSPARAIEHVARDDGDEYAGMIHRFRQWTYGLGRPDYRSVGFSDPDAQEGGLWRAVLEGREGPDDDSPVRPASTRPPHTSASLDDQHRTASGQVRLAAGGAEYVELTGPTDVVGTLHVEVEGPDGQTSVSIIDSVSDFPVLCPYWVSRAEAGAEPAGAARGVTVESDEDYLGGEGCGNAVAVITNTAPMVRPSIADLPQPYADYTWTATFVPLGAQLSDGNLDVGMHRAGTLGYEWVGVEQSGSELYPLDVEDEGWGVADGSAGAGVQGRAYRNPYLLGDLELTSFESSATSGTSLMQAGDLLVRHHVRPSPVAGMYAIDVRVERTGGVAATPVRYRRTMNWDGAWDWTFLSTWFRPDGGDDSAVLALTDGPSSSDPTETPGGDDVRYAVPEWPSYDGGGRTMDLDLGQIASGDSVSFTLYYGLQADGATATAAATALGADVYSVTEHWAAEGEPVGVFAYRAG